MSEFEVKLLNLFATAEFLGALKLGAFAKEVTQTDLKVNLIKHCQEEVGHSLLIYEFLKKNNQPTINPELRGKKFPTFFYSEYTEDLIGFLVFVHLFELRVPFIYGCLKDFTNNDEIKNICSQLIEEEDNHLAWIRKFLQNQQKDGNSKVSIILNKFSKNENKANADDLTIFESLEGGGIKFARLIRERLDQYEKTRADYFKESFGI